MKKTLKKTLYAFMLVMVSVLMLPSCGDDSNEQMQRTGNPAVDAQGEYEGAFTRVTKGLDDAVSASGTVIINPGQSANTANISFICEAFGVAVTRTFNFTFSNDGYAFSNHLSDDANTKMSAMAGRIDGQRNLTTKFTMSIRSGRKTVQYDFEFKGQK